MSARVVEGLRVCFDRDFMCAVAEARHAMQFFEQLSEQITGEKSRRSPTNEHGLRIQCGRAQ